MAFQDDGSGGGEGRRHPAGTARATVGHNSGQGSMDPERLEALTEQLSKWALAKQLRVGMQPLDIFRHHPADRERLLARGGLLTIIEAGRRKALGATALHVLALIVVHADDDRTGGCTLSQGRMAEEFGVGRDTINAAIAQLVEHGFIERQMRYKADSSRDTDVLVPIIPNIVASDERLATISLNGSDRPAKTPEEHLRRERFIARVTEYLLDQIAQQADGEGVVGWTQQGVLAGPDRGSRLDPTQPASSVQSRSPSSLHSEEQHAGTRSDHEPSTLPHDPTALGSSAAIHAPATSSHLDGPTTSHLKHAPATSNDQSVTATTGTLAPPPPTPAPVEIPQKTDYLVCELNITDLSQLTISHVRSKTPQGVADWYLALPGMTEGALLMRVRAALGDMIETGRAPTAVWEALEQLRTTYAAKAIKSPTGLLKATFPNVVAEIAARKAKAPPKVDKAKKGAKGKAKAPKAPRKAKEGGAASAAPAPTPKAEMAVSDAHKAAAEALWPKVETIPGASLDRLAQLVADYGQGKVEVAIQQYHTGARNKHWGTLASFARNAKLDTSTRAGKHGRNDERSAYKNYDPGPRRSSAGVSDERRAILEQIAGAPTCRICDVDYVSEHAILTCSDVGRLKAAYPVAAQLLDGSAALFDPAIDITLNKNADMGRTPRLYLIDLWARAVAEATPGSSDADNRKQVLDAFEREIVAALPELQAADERLRARMKVIDGEHDKLLAGLPPRAPVAPVSPAYKLGHALAATPLAGDNFKRLQEGFMRVAHIEGVSMAWLIEQAEKLGHSGAIAVQRGIGSLTQSSSQDRPTLEAYIRKGHEAILQSRRDRKY